MQKAQSDTEYKITDQMVNELAETFDQLGMKDVYGYELMYHALKQTKGSKDLAMDIILSNQVNMPASGTLNHQVDFNQSRENPRSYNINESEVSSSMGSHHTTAVDKLQMNGQMQQREKKKEPLPTNERYRDYKLPSGIKNIGNSKSYLSSFD